MDGRWTRGCGIGCVVLALVMVMLVGGGLWYARRMNAEFKTVRAGEEALFEAHGTPAEWKPSELVPAADRVAIFVELRSGQDEWRRRLADHTRFVTGIAQEETNALNRFIRSVRAGSELATLYAGFWTARNKALLEAGMGAGEYIWLYHLCYYAWLGEDPAAGSDQDAWYGGDADPGEPGYGEDRLRERMRELVMPMLEGAVAAADSAAAWRDEELARLVADPDRYPWETDLPPAMATAFESRRAAQAADWEPLVNPIELMFELEE